MFGSWLNGLPKNFKPLVLVVAAVLCCLFSSAEMQCFFYNKQSFFLQVSQDFVITNNPSESYFAGLSCSSVSFFGASGQEFFLLGYMGGGLVVELTVISVSGFLSNFCAF